MRHVRFRALFGLVREDFDRGESGSGCRSLVFSSASLKRARAPGICLFLEILLLRSDQVRNNYDVSR